MMINNSIPYHGKAYVCTHVFNKDKPILLVDREDGDWCFLCGAQHDDTPRSCRVVGIGHVFEDDPTLEAIRDLEPEWEAERQVVGGPWIRTRCGAGDC
ncbi:hypothetical protein [Azospirillum sp. sgz301742]